MSYPKYLYCVNGHRFLEGSFSLLTDKRGHVVRRCKECLRQRSREYYRRKVTAAITPLSPRSARTISLAQSAFPGASPLPATGPDASVPSAGVR